MKRQREDGKPASVRPSAKQAGEAEVETSTPAIATGSSRYAWAEPCVWSERMLTALDKGVKGGKWFSLIDKVYSRKTLLAAFARVRANKGAPGIDRMTIAQFEKNLEAEIDRLSRELESGEYRPRAVKRVMIPKPGSKEMRPLGIPTVRDRVAQAALRMVIEPIFERDFAEDSYGFRPARGCKDALREVVNALNEGLHFVVDADIKGYFDTIPHEPLMKLIEGKVSDGRVLDLIRGYLKMDIFDGIKTWTPEGGTPQGAIISPLLSNIYLDPLDHLMAGKGYKMVRYADDFVILTDSMEKAEAALLLVQKWMSEAGLVLHPEKTRITDASQKGGGFDFLGYHFLRKGRWARKKSVQKLKARLKPLTKRANGHSMERIIATVNPILRGWFEYFKHGSWIELQEIDGWVRGRLRSILRKRKKRKGRGRGSDHQVWPNTYFAGFGLFSLMTTRETAAQSALR